VLVLWMRGQLAHAPAAGDLDELSTECLAATREEVELDIDVCLGHCVWASSFGGVFKVRIRLSVVRAAGNLDALEEEVGPSRGQQRWVSWPTRTEI
jgi:hypothetical protein